MSKHLLPCECGKAITIDTSQAGQQIACTCGKLLEIPTLRGVRELEPAQATAAPSRPAVEWDASRGMIFAGSFILFVIGAGASYFGYDGLRATPNITREAEAETFDKAIDNMSPEEAYETWKSIREYGLGPRGQNAYVNIRNFRAGRKRILAVGIALCVLGLAGAMGTTLRRRAPAAA